MSSVLLLARPSQRMTALVSGLEKQHFTVSFPEEGTDMIETLAEASPEVVLIETGTVPDTGRLCRYLKQERRLALIALAPVEVAGRLDGRFDDFALLTATVQEIAVRIERILEKGKKTADPGQMVIGKLVIDTERFEVFVDGRPVSLTYKEYELLRFLASNPGRVFTRDTLLNRVWGEDYFGGDRTVDVHVRRLRGKIEEPETTYIETVRNIGYRFKKQS